VGRALPRAGPALLCLPIRNARAARAEDDPAAAFALLTDTQRPMRIGKQSKGLAPGRHDPARNGVAYR